jgi:hypothetical protein
VVRNLESPDEACVVMQRKYQFIKFDKDGDIFCVSFAKSRVEDEQLEEVGAELADSLMRKIADSWS